MTWQEFKDAVDKHLEEEGISPDTEIWYIDIAFPSKDDFEQGRLEASVYENCGIYI